jgi:hypothetical protein
MSDAAAGIADDGRREVRPLVTLPRLVTKPAAVQALEVYLLHRAVQHCQLVQVAGTQCDSLN